MQKKNLAVFVQQASNTERQAPTGGSGRLGVIWLTAIQRIDTFMNCSRRLLVPLVVVLGAGCGYLQAGEWQDHPKNWERAFGSARPGDVVEVHSRYWRSAHWSWESGYEFEVEANRRFQEELFTRNRLAETKDDLRYCPGSSPWFAPKPLDSYQVWVYADQPKGNFRVLIDRADGTIFMCDYQL